MRRLSLVFLLLSAIGWAQSPAYSTKNVQPAWYTVGTLPTQSANQHILYGVYDGTSGTDCTVGGGSSLVLCAWTGSAWSSVGGSGAGGGTLLPSGTPTAGQIALWVDTTHLQGVSTLPSLTLAGTGAGMLGLTQGVAQTALANSFGLQAPTSIPTGYLWTVPSADCNGLLNVSSDLLGCATAHNVVTPLTCADVSASGTAQSCTTSPSFTPAANDCVLYTTTTTNSGVGLTTNINALGAKSIAIPGASGWTTTLTASIIPANKPLLLCYDGTNWNVQQTGTAASSNLPSQANATVLSNTSGGSAAPSANALPTTLNALIKTNSANGALAASATTDDGTTSTYTGTGGTKSPAFTATGTTAGFADYPQGTTSAAVAPCNTANSICEEAPAAVTSYRLDKPGAAPTIVSIKQTDTCGSAICTETFHPAPIVLRVTTDFTDASSTALQAITGLGFTFPINSALNAKIDCDILYNQTVGAVADAWGVQDVTVAPTNVEATGVTQTAATTWSEQQLLTLATTTATNIGTFTPSAITTVWHARLHVLVEHPSNASTSAFNIMVSQSTAADLMVIKRGSSCLVTFQ